MYALGQGLGVTAYRPPDSHPAWRRRTARPGRPDLLSQLVVSAAVGAAYALVIQGLGQLMHLPGGLLPPLTELLRTVTGGVLVNIEPAIHPFLPAFLPLPGAPLARLGALGVLIFVPLHVIYSVLAGGIPTRKHSPPARPDQSPD